MNTEIYKKIQKLSQDRIDFMTNHTWDWYKGSETYFEALSDELQEVWDEIKHDNAILLEDELCDVFWCQMCLLHSLKAEWKIRSVEDVLERVYEKFSQRVWEDGKWGKMWWQETKLMQAEVLEKRHNDLYK